MYGFQRNDSILALQSTLMCHKHNDVSVSFMQAQHWLPHIRQMSCVSSAIMTCSVHPLILLWAQVPSIPCGGADDAKWLWLDHLCIPKKTGKGELQQSAGSS